MDIKEEDLYQLGEALEANTSVLRVALNYDLELDNRDYSRGIEELYEKCLNDYNLANMLLDEDENHLPGAKSSITENGVIIEEDDNAWMMLEYDRLGDKMKD